MKKNVWIRLLYLMFFLSGAAGLVYQVVWARLFGLIFGNTIFASSTVLAAFMGGMAIGSFLFGKYISKKSKDFNGLKIYCIMELCVGVFGALMPAITGGLGNLYTAIYHAQNPSFDVLTVYRFVLSFLVMAAPCVFMGATLPVLSSTLTDVGGEGKGVIGRLYGINTIGAVAGCLFAGFLFIGRLGIQHTSILAACINGAVAALALLLYTRLRKAHGSATPAEPEKAKTVGGPKQAAKGYAASHGAKAQVYKQNTAKDKREAMQPRPEPAPEPERKHTGLVLLVCYGFCGFAAMALEVAWTKSLVWIMAMDSYAFAAMLSVILAGIGLGSLAHTLVAKRIKNDKVLLVAAQFALGLSVLLSIDVIQHSVALQNGLQTMLSHAGALSTLYKIVSPITIYQLALSALVLLLPSLLMGFVFPVISGLFVRIRGKVGEGVGDIYSINTLGGIAGSLLMGFVLMPAIGLLPSIAAMAGIYLATAAVLLAVFTPAYTRARVLKIGGCAAIALLFVFLTDYRSVDYIKTTLTTAAPGDQEKLLYFKENATGDVLVKQSKTYGSEMLIDGVQVASDGEFDLHSHLYPAHLMSLLKKDPKDVLVVAFGCGGTSGSILKYNDVDRLDVVEICDGVVAPAKQYFSQMNSGVFDSPKLNLIIQDGKNYVHMTDKHYDIIYSGPIHPQSNQGSAALYTKEYFEDCRSKLKPDGFQCLWLPLHMSSSADFKIIVKTFMDVYPYVSLWMLPQTNTSVAHPHLIGSMVPIYPDYQVISEKMNLPGIRQDIARMNESGFSQPYEFISQLFMGEDALKQFVAGITDENTDDLPIVEYYDRPVNYQVSTTATQVQLLADIEKHMENPYKYVQNVPEAEKAELEQQLDRLYSGNKYLVEGHFYLTAKSILSTDVDSKIRENYQKAYELIPESAYLKKYLEENPAK